MTLTVRGLCVLSALVLAVVPAFADTNTQVSPGIGPLPATFSPMGGILIDMVGANGKRLTAQISPTNLPKGRVTDTTRNFWAFWSQTGFDSYTLQTLLGGGLQKVNIRVTLQDGDSGSPNPVYNAVFGANSMPYSGSGARCLSCLTSPGNASSKPAGWDFDSGTDLYIAIPLAGGGYINCGYMGQTTTYQLDSSGNTTQSYTGFPGVYALTDYSPFPVAQFPRFGYTPFAVTGWFSVPSGQLTALYNTLAASGSMTLGIWDVDPGDQYYDFTQGVAATITDVPLIPPEIISFTASPSTVVGSGTVTLSWQTGAVTAVSIDQGVTINPAQVNGSIQVPVSSATTFTLTATSPQGSTTATASVTILPPLTIGTTSLLPALSASPYSMTLSAAGGTSPYKWTLASGSLPTGLSLSSAGTISGIPSAAGSSSFVVQANDATIPTQAATAAFTLTVNPALSITTTALPNGVISSSYTQTFGASGGTPAYAWSLVSGSLPTGLNLSPAGVISGVPTKTGASSFTIKATDGTSPTPQTATQTYSITVGAQLAIQTNILAIGVVGATYTQGLLAAGGTQPYTWSLDAGALPDGLALGSSGAISGTPTAPGSKVFVVRVTDSTLPSAQTATQTFSIYVVGRITIDTTSLPDATAAHPYAQALNAHSGIQPYVWTLAAGSLPPGIALLATGALIGTPNVAGTYSFTLQATDSTAPTPQSATQPYTLTVNPSFTITTTGLPGASTGVPYNASVQATDGIPPYSFAVLFGDLAPGLTLSATGQITGTPTKPGIYNMLIRATDSTKPSAQTCDQPLTLTVDSTLSIATASLLDGTQGVQYTGTLTALNGLQPYSWTVTGGALPDGLSLLPSGTIVGMPTRAGTFHVTIQATDSSQPNPTISTRSYTLAIEAPLSITNAALPNGLTGAPYVSIFTTAGGQPQYTYSFTDGTLPPGLTLSQIGVIQGTPTAPGSFTFTVQVSDSSLTPSAVNRTYTIAINQPLNITTPPALPPATLDSLYSLQLTATGGLTPYTWSTQSTLPNGIQLLSTGILIGVPTQSGTYQINLHLIDVTKDQPQSVSLAVTLTVTPPLLINATPFPSILPSVPYSAAAQATGGVPPYAWAVAGGSLPTGLSLNSDGTLASVTSASGSYDIQLTVTDSGSPENSATQEFVLLIAAPFAVTTTSPIETGILGKSYSQTLTLSGGKGPYSWSVVGGALPAGIALSNSGVLSGSPTAAGAANFVVQCKDAANETAIKPLTLLIRPPLGIVSGMLPAAVAKTVYFHLFQASDGTPGFHWTITNGSLPAGLTLTDDGLLTGTTSTPGTYPLTIGLTDNTSPTPQMAAAQITLSVIQPLIAVPQTFTAYTGTTFSQSLTATGGTTPYTWTLASGPLPPGLSLSGSTIAGTATKAGQYPVVINVTDASGLTVSALYGFAVTEQLTILLPLVAAGTNGLSYAYVLSAFGGAAPYVWTITSGSLPQGLTLSTTGIISGTPTATGSFPFTAVVTDSAAQTATKQYTLQIQAAPPGLTIPPASVALPIAVVGAAYVGSLAVTGGTAPHMWSLAPGASLPAGFTLNGAAIVGTPTTAGTYTFALTVQDANGLTATSAYVLTVGSGLVITTTSIPTAIQGAVFSEILTAVGGTPPYTWSGTLPFGLKLSRTGVISGTPNGQGGGSATIGVTDSSRPALTASKSITVTSTQALIITTANAPQFTVGTTTNITLQAQGGESPYTWNVTGGVLPPGLTVTAAGAATGTPTKAGSYLATVRVADSSPAPVAVTAQVLFTVVDALTITTITLPAASTANAYTAPLQAQGGTAPYSWSIASGTLPIGLTISGSAITGWPSTQGTSAFVLKVSDATGLAVTQALKLIVAGPLTISSTTLPTATINAAFTYTLQSTGGTAPYTWTALSGSVPTGLTISPSGAVSGTLTATGTSIFTVKVTDAGNPQLSATAVLSLTVNSNLAITTASVPQATATILYRVAFTATGGVAPYTWRISFGTLPVGLILTSAGVLTGTPVTSDGQTVTVQVTDSQNQTASANYRIIVGPAPTLSLQLSPAGATLDPLTQQPLQLTLATAYPMDITGHIALTGAQDPDATFIQNGQARLSFSFTIPAGSTTALFTGGPVLLQSGTSSQAFTATATTDSPQQTATQQYTVLLLPPKLTSGQYSPTSDGFNLTLQGFSTTREVQSATFRFHSADTSSAPYTMSVANIFQAWYQSSSSAGSGIFLYHQPFVMSGLGSITSVDVTLTNSVGTSSVLTLTPEAH